MENNKSSVGGTIATIIIIALVVLGGLYFWGKRLEESKKVAPFNTESATSTATVQNESTAIKNTSPTDDTNSIEADLNATAVTGLDGELNN